MALESASESNAITQAVDVFDAFDGVGFDVERTLDDEKSNRLIDFDNIFGDGFTALRNSRYAKKANEVISPLSNLATSLFVKYGKPVDIDPEIARNPQERAVMELLKKNNGVITKADVDGMVATAIVGLNELNAKYAGKKMPLVQVEVVMDKNLPRVMITLGGENIEALDRAKVDLLDAMMYYSTAAGFMQKSEVTSAINAFNLNEDNIASTLKQLRSNIFDLPPTLINGMLQEAVNVSIGNYNRSTDQKDPLPTIMNLFQRWQHERNVNQTTGVIERWRQFYAIQRLMGEDLMIKRFAKLGIAPLGEYFVANGGIQALGMTVPVVVKSAVLNPVVLRLVWPTVATMMAGALAKNDQLNEIWEEMTGMGLLPSSWLTAAANISVILYRSLFGEYSNPQQAKGEANAISRPLQNLLGSATGFGGTAAIENATMLTYLGLRELGRQADLIEDPVRQAKGDKGYFSPNTLKQIDGALQEREMKIIKTASQVSPFTYGAFQTWESFKQLTEKEE